jgi:hypothetical protein
MLYFVRAEFVEENIAGKPFAEVSKWIEQVVHPSLLALDKLVQEKKVTGGTIAGVREGVFIMDFPSNEVVGEFLRGLPFWGAMKWTVSPLQSLKSAVEQDEMAFRKARAMAAGQR